MTQELKLSLEKQFTHANFCSVADRLDRDNAIALLKDLHRLYLVQSQVFMEMSLGTPAIRNLDGVVEGLLGGGSIDE
jgi:hypothetical protein